MPKLVSSASGTLYLDRIDMTPKILLVGSTGKLGNTILRLLRERGHAVRALVRNQQRAGEIATLAAETVRGDLRDIQSLRRACAGMTHVVTTANSFAGKGANKSVNVDLYGNLNLIDAARAEGVQRFVFVSGDVMAPDSLVDFFRYKFQAEEHLRASGMDYVIIRPGAFMDEWANIVAADIPAKGTATIFGDGKNPIGFVARDAVAELVARVVDDATVTRESITIGGPENLTLLQVVEKFEKHHGRTAKRKHVPVPAMRVLRVLTRPFNQVLSRMMSAGIEIATRQQAIDAAKFQSRFPDVRLQSMDAWLSSR